MTAEASQGRELRIGTAGIITLTWASIILPSLIQTFTAPKHRMFTGETVQYSQAAVLASTACSLSLALLCIVVTVRYLPRLPGSRRGLLLIILVPWIYQVSRDLYLGTAPKTGGLLYPLIVIALWAARPRLRQLVVLGYLVGGTAVLSVLMGVLTPTKGVLTSMAGDLVTPDKQILPWGILVGPLSDGNPLAQFLMLGIPAMALVPRRWVRWPLIAVTTVAVVWTSCRSALLAIGAMALIALLLLALRSDRLRRIVSLVVCTGAAAVVVALPLTVTDPGALSNRGYIWRASLNRYLENPVVGLGSQWYGQSAKYTTSIASTAFHGHNEAVQALVLGGAANLVLVSILFGAVVWNASTWTARYASRVPATFAVALLVTSTMEVSYSFVHRSYLLPVTVIPVAFAFFSHEQAPAAPAVTPGDGATVITLGPVAAGPVSPGGDLAGVPPRLPAGPAPATQSLALLGKNRRTGGTPRVPAVPELPPPPPTPAVPDASTIPKVPTPPPVPTAPKARPPLPAVTEQLPLPGANRQVWGAPLAVQQTSRPDDDPRGPIEPPPEPGTSDAAEAPPQPDEPTQPDASIEPDAPGEPDAPIEPDAPGEPDASEPPPAPAAPPSTQPLALLGKSRPAPRPADATPRPARNAEPAPSGSKPAPQPAPPAAQPPETRPLELPPS